MSWYEGLVATVTTGLSTGGAAISVIALNLAVVGFMIWMLTKMTKRSVFFLGKEEQLKVQCFTETVVRNGPGLQVLNPFGYRSAVVVKACTLGTMDHVKVQDRSTGSERIEKGPKLLFLGPYENADSVRQGLSLTSTDYVIVDNKVSGERTVVKGPCVWFPGPHDQSSQGCATSLSRTEYIIVNDRLTGHRAIQKGPCVWFPKPYDSASSKKTAIALQDDEYIKLKDTSTGRRWVQKGKALVFCEPTWVVEDATAKSSGAQKAWALKSYEYVRLLNGVTGQVAVHRGERTVFPEADETLLDGDKMAALDLKVQEYVKILDQATGDIRVVGGTNQVFLGPNERFLDGGKKNAIEIDSEHAVLVRDKKTGQQRLIQEHQLFVPGPYETIEEVRDLIKLADHEALLIKDKNGEFHYYYGSDAKRRPDQPRSFFLPPNCEIVKQCWSRGRRRERRDLYISVFDCRAQFMSFEFNSRTRDNVEMVLEGTFFWEVVDLPTMVKKTGDTPGDICAHARSQFIKHVAKVTLKQFMEGLHVLSTKVFEEDPDFFTNRGVKVHSLEVTRYQCAERNTAEILEQIIQETTNRMNRLSQAESENEVKLFQMHGEIAQERLNGDLLQIQHKHAQEEQRCVGSAEAQKAASFITGLSEDVPKLEERIEMWGTLRQQEALTEITQGKGRLYYTPEGIDLKIDSK